MATELSRRQFLKIGGGGLLGLYVGSRLGGFTQVAEAAIPGGTLDPADVPKYVTPLLIPPVMPKAGTIKLQGGKHVDYYEISVRQFAQQILPAGLPTTTVWGYGAVKAASDRGLLLHNAPSLTIEAQSAGRCGSSGSTTSRTPTATTCRTCCRSTRPCTGPTRRAGSTGRDTRPDVHRDPGPYTGPGADGHPRARRGRRRRRERRLRRGLVPAGRHEHPGRLRHARAPGTTSSGARPPPTTARTWGPGFATFQYPNENRASTIWYHDHALGMTRLNVYAGPAGFYIVRGGPPATRRCSTAAPARPPCCPARRPRRTTSSRPTRPTTRSRSPSRTARSTPTARCSTRTRARSSTSDAGPYIPDTDLSPDLEPRVLRQHDHGQRQHLAVPDRRAAALPLPLPQRLPVALPDPRLQPDPRRRGLADRQRGRLPGGAGNLTATNGNQLLMGLAERADLIVDFTNVPVGNYVLGNVGPDEPFGGGVPDDDFDARRPGHDRADHAVPRGAGRGRRPDDAAAVPVLPAIAPLPAPARTRPLALLEMMSMDRCDDGPAEAMLGIVDDDGIADAPDVGSTPSPRTRASATPRSGSSTTSPPTPTRCTSTRSSSRW